MELAHVAVARSNDIAFDSLQFNEEIERLISPPPTENGSSFTALLELPPTQAVELLHSPDTSTSHSTLSLGSRKPHFHATDYEAPPLPLSSDPLGCTSSFSAFAGEKVKHEAVTESASKSSSPSEPVVSDPASENKGRQPGKRKERELKGKGSAKKSKTENSQDAQLLPYVHVRARRGQATDSHSLAERARREKINARMKLLQELVPGCSKISGTALVLDEIINHVQSLQRQVELLSMKLAAVNPRMDFNLDSIFAPEMGPLIDSGFPNMIMPLVWPEVHVNGRGEQFQQQWHFNPLHQQGWGKEEDAHNLMTPEVSLLSYDSSANTVSPHSDPLKVEL